MPGYEGLYEAGPGAVRSLDRLDSRGRRIKGVVLKPGILKDGRPLIVLCKNGVRWSVKLHKVIALTFHGPCPPGLQVCHDDGDILNNPPDNLYYGTPRQNQLDSIRHGTHWEVNKTHCPLGHELAEPNIYRRPSRPHWRECLACVRARSRHLRGGTFEERAVEAYAEIMTR